MNDAPLNLLSDALLATLRRKPSRSFSLERLAKIHDCRKSDIIFAVDLLRRLGYNIKSDHADQFAFESAPDILLASEIAAGLKTSFIGRTIYAYHTVQSTNLLAAQLAEANAPDGALVIAESQTRGRGRMARPWFSPEHAGIYLSIILYPKINPVDAPGLSIMTALSLADTIAAYDELKVGIKWPNDCLINNRKTAGILTELSADMISVHYVVIGVGININQRRQDFPPEIKKTSTSLRAELKSEIRRVEFLQNFLKRFEKDYRRFCQSGLKSFRRRILALSSLLGKTVKLDLHGTVVSGKAVDIDRHGNLVLETADGRRPFTAGDVTVIKK